MTGRFLLRLIAAPAIYGLSVGAVHSLQYALLNAVKFPLLIGVTAAVSLASHTLVARFFGVRLAFADVRRLVLEGYGDLSVLLASLAAVLLFFARTFVAPASLDDLGEYPLFLGLNVVLIAACGSLSLVRQANTLLREQPISRARARAVVVGWLSLSLLVGSQGAWFLRPFFGNRAAHHDFAFCLGNRPDFRGATSFYEAAFDLVAQRTKR